MKLHGCGKTTDREKYFNAFAIHRTLDCHRTTPRVGLKKFLIDKKISSSQMKIMIQF